MSPSSAKRRSTRTRAPTSRKLETGSSSRVAKSNTNSPSRPAKRRKTVAASAPEAPKEPVEETEDVDMSDETDDEDSNMALTELADKIIPHLYEATTYVPVVAVSHVNKDTDTGNTVSAYAKIAGKAWTYYVTDPAIIIGRQGTGTQGIGNADAADEEKTHIDLGPSKLVSRTHAEMYYESSDEKWHLKVMGRNGVKVNDELFRPTPPDFSPAYAVLRSGDVLEIAGTEMVFISPDVKAAVHPKFLARLEEFEQDIEGVTQLEEGPQSKDNSNRIPEAPKNALAPPKAGAYPTIARGQVSIAPAPPSFAHPSTPTNSHLQTAPYLTQGITKGSPVTGQPAASNPSGIDWASDSTKDQKPPYPYQALISRAILSDPREKISLNNIYEYIKQNFSYYRHLEQGWQNSIRHNLSLNKYFIKVPRDIGESGKGGLWTIEEDKIQEYREQGLQTNRRGGARTDSPGNSSPARKRSPRKSPKETIADAGPSSALKNSQSPPNYLATQVAQAQTPTRGPRTARTSMGQAPAQTMPELSDNASPVRHQILSQNGTAGSDAYTLYTPAPQRFEPKLTAPSTGKLPSMYLPQSSPVPYWFENASTNGPPGSSPAKDGQTAAANLMSSSPVPAQTRRRISPPPIARSNGLSLSKDVQEGGQDGNVDLMGQFPKIGGTIASSAH